MLPAHNTSATIFAQHPQSPAQCFPHVVHPLLPAQCLAPIGIRCYQRNVPILDASAATSAMIRFYMPPLIPAQRFASPVHLPQPAYIYQATEPTQNRRENDPPNETRTTPTTLAKTTKFLMAIYSTITFTIHMLNRYATYNMVLHAFRLVYITCIPYLGKR